MNPPCIKLPGLFLVALKPPKCRDLKGQGVDRGHAAMDIECCLSLEYAYSSSDLLSGFRRSSLGPCCRNGVGTGKSLRLQRAIMVDIEVDEQRYRAIRVHVKVHRIHSRMLRSTSTCQKERGTGQDAAGLTPSWTYPSTFPIQPMAEHEEQLLITWTFPAPVSDGRHSCSARGFGIAVKVKK